jgi:hypothetical protein
MRRVFVSAILFLCLTAPGWLVAQQSPCDQNAAPITAETPSGLPPVYNGGAQQQDQATVELQRKQMESRNKERQSSLKKDTEQLLQLATQLKQSVDKTNEHVLSLDVIKKTEAVEKLAKSIREKMRANGYCDFPPVQ